MLSATPKNKIDDPLKRIDTGSGGSVGIEANMGLTETPLEQQPIRQINKQYTTQASTSSNIEYMIGSYLACAQRVTVSGFRLGEPRVVSNGIRRPGLGGPQRVAQPKELHARLER